MLEYIIQSGALGICILLGVILFYQVKNQTKYIDSSMEVLTELKIFISKFENTAKSDSEWARQLEKLTMEFKFTLENQTTIFKELITSIKEYTRDIKNEYQ